MHFIRSLLYHFDRFKISVDFVVKSKKKLSTSCGGFLSIMILCFSLVNFSQSDLFHKNSPSISIQSLIPSPRPLIKFSKQNFSISIRIADDFMNLFDDSSIFTIDFINLQINNSEINQRKVVKNRMKKCQTEDFPSDNEINENYNLSYCFCIPIESFQLQGFWDLPLFDYFKIQVNKCDNSSSNITCQSSEKIEKFFEDKHFDLFLSDFAFDLSNYEKPKREFLRLIQTKPAIPFIKTSTITIQKTLLINDGGKKIN